MCVFVCWQLFNDDSNAYIRISLANQNTYKEPFQPIRTPSENVQNHQARESVQLVQKAGNRVTDDKRGKTGIGHVKISAPHWIKRS